MKKVFRLSKLQKHLPKLLGKQLSVQYVFLRRLALKRAFRLFCSPKKGKLKQEQQPFLQTADTKVLSIEGLDIHTYHWKGSGPTVALIHGWESNSYRWRNLIEKLKNLDYNIVAFDAPAHGNSTGDVLHVPLYTKCLNKVMQQYNPSFLVGHSIGGMTSIFYQHLHNNPIVQKIVVLAPPSELSSIMEQYKKALGLSKRFMSSLNERFLTNFGYTFKDFSMAQFSSTIKTSGMVIHDRFDAVVPFTEALQISRKWKSCKLVSTKHLGHSLHSPKVDDLILNFLTV